VVAWTSRDVKTAIVLSALVLVHSLLLGGNTSAAKLLFELRVPAVLARLGRDGMSHSAISDLWRNLLVYPCCSNASLRELRACQVFALVSVAFF
jgi:hypothetical protein